MSSSELSVGKRLRIGDDYGTILFLGEVAGTSGIWLGVEWDDGAKRGKHSGERNGVKYFTCRTPNAGSFLRPNTPGIVTGIDFCAALLNKYVDDLRTDGKDSVVLGSSNGAIIVEAPRLDGVRARISQVEKLRRISLDDCDVSIPGELEAIEKLCPSVQSLNLSRTLLGSWEEILDIIGQMPSITTLELNYNRLHFTRPKEDRKFLKLTHLRLNSTMISWAEACEVLVHFPQLQDLQLGHNQLQNLGQSHSSDKIPSSLIALNLDSNALNDWVSTMQTCSVIPSLESLMLPSNAISLIPCHSEISSKVPPLLQIKHLFLTNNPITSWEAIDSITTWLPNLKDLSISLEPLKLSGSSSAASRDFIVARLSQLTRLNGGDVTERDRTDAELFYLSWISKHETGTDQDIQTKHPRWKELSHKHQTSSETVKPVVQNLGSSMISVNVICLHNPISKGRSINLNSPAVGLKVLPSMSTKVFAMKLKKSMKTRNSIEPENLWIMSRVEDDHVVPLRQFDTDLLREIAWSGVEDGCYIGLIEP